MKTTKVQALPWKKCTLGDAIKFQRGFDLPGRLRRAGQIPIVSSSGITDYHQIAAASGPGVVTGRYGTIGEVFYVEGDYWPLNTTLYVKDFKGNSPLFISHLLKTVDFASHSGKSGVPGVNRNDLHELEISLPPLAEQNAIASALSDMDALLAKLDQLIAKKRDIKQAAMQELLTGRRRLPGFSGEWAVAALRNLGAWKGGATPSMSNPDFWENGDVPWASSGDIKSTTIDATAKNITERAVESSSTTVVPAGSVVMVTRSGILRRYFPVAKTSKPIAINQDIKALIPASGVDSEFVLQSLLLHGPDILSSCMKAGTTVESIELSWLKAYEIGFPSLDEQQAIATILRDMAAEITALEARREKNRLIKQGMMQELLSGRVRLI